MELEPGKSMELLPPTVRHWKRSALIAARMRSGATTSTPKAAQLAAIYTRVLVTYCSFLACWEAAFPYLVKRMAKASPSMRHGTLSWARIAQGPKPSNAMAATWELNPGRT